MGVSRRHLALGAVLVALSVGCSNPADTSHVGAGGDAETSAATSGDQTGGNGDGSGGGGGSGGSDVIGSPIRMPGFQQIGAEIVTVYDGLVAEIASACGPGGLCVEIVVESEDGQGPESTCGFAGTRPGEDELVERGSTVVFLTTPPCPDFEGTSGTEGEVTPDEGATQSTPAENPGS